METENPKPEVKLAPFLQRNKKKRAHEVFMNFVKYQPRLDVSGVLSKECYKAWLDTRWPKPRQPEEGYQAAVMNHFRGKKRSKPFPKEVEEALIPLLRRKRAWPCFEGTGKTIGCQGIDRSIGFHESKRVGCQGNNRIVRLEYRIIKGLCEKPADSSSSSSSLLCETARLGSPAIAVDLNRSIETSDSDSNCSSMLRIEKKTLRKQLKMEKLAAVEQAQRIALRKRKALSKKEIFSVAV